VLQSSALLLLHRTAMQEFQSFRCITQATISQTNFTLPQDWSLLRQCSSVNGYAVTEISVYCKDVFRGSFSFLS